MVANIIEENFKGNLHYLYENKKISSSQLEHFLKRGIQVIRPKEDFNLGSLSSILPNIVIGASKSYISKLKIPYQATSYIAAEVFPNSKRYIYKVPGNPGGGVVKLTGDKRNIGDSVFASTHRILLGNQAILLSIYNLMINKNHIWNWEFFGNKMKESNEGVFNDLRILYEQFSKNNQSSYVIVVSRNPKSFDKSGIIHFYQKKEVAIFNQDRRKILFLTNQEGYDYSSKYIPESDFIQYVVTGSEFNIFDALRILKKKYQIDIILNDGGRIMSNGFKDSGVLGEERITLEPYPGKVLIQKENQKVIEESTLGIKGTGIDNSEISEAILLYSYPFGQEKMNVYVYPLDDSRVLFH